MIGMKNASGLMSSDDAIDSLSRRERCTRCAWCGSCAAAVEPAAASSGSVWFGMLLTSGTCGRDDLFFDAGTPAAWAIPRLAERDNTRRVGRGTGNGRTHGQAMGSLRQAISELGC